MYTMKLSAGDIVEARCTRCRKVLNHRIVAMIEEKIVRVECNTCAGVHNFHPAAAPKDAKISRRAVPGSKTAPKTSAVQRAVRVDPVDLERAEWTSLQPTFNHESAVPYDMNGLFKTGQLILHPVFGTGVVKTVIIPSKMQVLFKDGIKLLRCQ